MKYFKITGIALLVVIIIIIIFAKVGLFDYILMLQSDKAINLGNILTVVNVTLGLLSVLTLVVYTVLTAELVVSDMKPKLYVAGKIIDCGNSWDKSVMLDILEGGTSSSLKAPGFVYKSANKKWDIEVHNNGNSPVTNVEVTYSVIAYKNEIIFGVDEADIVDFYPVKYATKKDTIKIDYIPPYTNQTFTVFYMDKFPKADLVVEGLKCDGQTFIKNLQR